LIQKDLLLPSSKMNLDSLIGFMRENSSIFGKSPTYNINCYSVTNKNLFSIMINFKQLIFSMNFIISNEFTRQRVHICLVPITKWDLLRIDWHLFDIIHSNDIIARGHIMNWRTFKSVGNRIVNNSDPKISICKGLNFQTLSCILTDGFSGI